MNDPERQEVGGPPAYVPPNEAERRARSQRNWAIFVALLALVALVFAVTVVKLGGSVADRPF